MVLVRTDLAKKPELKARAAHVVDTELATTLGHGAMLDGLLAGPGRVRLCPARRPFPCCVPPVSVLPS